MTETEQRGKFVKNRNLLISFLFKTLNNGLPVAISVSGQTCLVGRQEVEIYKTGSICHRGCRGHHSCHCWVNKLGRMIVLRVKNDPSHDVELILFSFFVLHALLLEVWVCVRDQIIRAWLGSETLQCREDRPKMQKTNRQASVLSPIHTQEIDGSIQVFSTPLIGFTGH